VRWIGPALVSARSFAFVPVSEGGGDAIHQRAHEVQHPRLGEEVEAACENGRVLRLVFPQQVRFRPLVRAAELQDVLNGSQALVVLDEELDGFGRHGGAPVSVACVRTNRVGGHPVCRLERKKKNCAIPTAGRDEGPSLSAPNERLGVGRRRLAGAVASRRRRHGHSRNQEMRHPAQRPGRFGRPTVARSVT
jgi:hypothetical protein